MDLITASQVSKVFGVSTRMLRYYEQIGLIESNRKDDYAYRVYDDAAIKRLQQIIILRKLQIPIKQIKNILNNQDAVTVIEIFQQNVDELDVKITALSAVKSILARFIEELQKKADIHLKFDLLNDKTMIAIMDSLSIPKSRIKENLSMDDLNKASETLSKLDEKKNSEVIGPVETQIKANQQKLEKFEIVKCGKYRFIGKAVYVRNDWGNPESHTGSIVGSVWMAKEWIFKTLDNMTEYITDMPYAGGLYIWDRYDEKNELQGYIIGKFMKAETPVPDGMDYFEIPEGYIAKGWGGFVEGEVKNMLRISDEYVDASWFWGGEVFADYEARADDGSCDTTKTGYFIACNIKENK